MSEAYTTCYVSQRLEQAGWIRDENNPDCNVFQQQSVKSRLNPLALELRFTRGSKEQDKLTFTKSISGIFLSQYFLLNYRQPC